MTPCSLVGRYESDGETWANVSVSRIVIFILNLEALFGSHNLGIHLPDYTVSQPREPHVLYSEHTELMAEFRFGLVHLK